MTDETAHELVTKLLTRHERAIYGFIYSLVPHRADADDIVQATMAQLWEHGDSYDPGRPFLPWANRFAYRQVLMHRRSLSRRQTVFSDATLEALASDEPAGADWEDARKRALDHCIQKLSKWHRKLIEHRYTHGTSLVELAELLDRSVNSLYKSLQGARQQLAECVTRRLAAEGKA